MNTTHKNNLQIVLSLCTTVVLLAAIGAWIYTNQQEIAQKDRELQQQEQLEKYKQSQINDRAQKDRSCSGVTNKSNPFMASNC